MATINKIRKLENIEQLNIGLFICLVGTNKTPPHIAIIANGKYYSTSVKGLKLGVSLQFLLKIIKQKQTPILFIKIDEIINQVDLKQCYQEYPALTNKESCLFPIRDYFKTKGWEVTNWNFVFNTLDDILKKEKVLASYHLNMENLLINNNFKLREYTKEEIISLIKELKALC